MTKSSGGSDGKSPKGKPGNRRSAADLLTLVTLDGIPTTHASTKAKVQSILKDEGVQERDYEPAIGHQGLTHKQEQFCQGVAQGLTLSAAYRAAYGCEGWKDESVWSKASTLASQVKVKERIKSLDQGLKPKAPHDPGEVKAEVLRTLRDILSDPKARHADRMKAAELLGKWGEVALFNEFSTVKVEAVEPAQAIEALKDKLKKLAS